MMLSLRLLLLVTLEDKVPYTYGDIHHLKFRVISNPKQYWSGGAKRHAWILKLLLLKFIECAFSHKDIYLQCNIVWFCFGLPCLCSSVHYAD